MRALAVLVAVSTTGCDLVFELEDPRVCLFDEFDATAIDSSTWAEIDPGGPIAVEQSGGRLHIPLPAMPQSASNGLVTRGVFDLTNATAEIELASPPYNGPDTATGGGVRFVFYVAGAGVEFGFIVTTGSLGLFVDVTGDDVAIEPFDLEFDRHMRLRFEGPKLVFETGSDGIQWTTRRTANDLAPLVDAEVGIFAETYSGGVPDPGTAEIERVVVRDCSR